MTERIDKFVVDITRWSVKNAANDEKLRGEVERLTKWLEKHQNEMIPDGHKNKLLSLVDLVYRYIPTSQDERIQESKRSLCSCYLMMPEGKLVNAKSKKKVMKWLDTLNVDTGAAIGSVFSCVNNSGNGDQSGVWLVADITEERKLTLMKEDVHSSDVLEDIDIDNEEMLVEIERRFDSDGGYVCVKMLNGVCVEICNNSEEDHSPSTS